MLKVTEADGWEHSTMAIPKPSAVGFAFLICNVPHPICASMLEWSTLIMNTLIAFRLANLVVCTCRG